MICFKWAIMRGQKAKEIKQKGKITEGSMFNKLAFTNEL